MAKGLNENTASSSQVWHSDENTNTSMVKIVAETIKRLSGVPTAVLLEDCFSRGVVDDRHGPLTQHRHLSLLAVCGSTSS